MWYLSSWFKWLFKKFDFLILELIYANSHIQIDKWPGKLIKVQEKHKWTITAICKIFGITLKFEMFIYEKHKNNSIKKSLKVIYKKKLEEKIT